MVLFVFVVMMLNRRQRNRRERQWLKPQVWTSGGFVGHYAGGHCAILGVNDRGIDGTPISAKAVGITLSGLMFWRSNPGRMLLLAGPWWRSTSVEERAGEVLLNRADDRAKRKRRSAHDPLNTRTDPLRFYSSPGLTGLVIRRNLLFMLIGLEIMITPPRWPLWSPGVTGARPMVR